MQKAYNRINWEDYPSENTPINEDNLNNMDSAINEIDNRVVNFDTTKANTTDVLAMISDVAFDETTGIFTFTRKNGATVTLDTKLEKLAINWTYDAINEVLIITLDDGTKQEVPLSALINEVDFIESDTIAFSVVEDKVSAIVKEGSIEEKHLQPNYLADVKAEVGKAQTAAESAAVSATESADSAVAAKEYAAAAAESAEKAEAITGPVVSGLKGSAETDYRTGQVTITPENLGLGDVLEVLGDTDISSIGDGTVTGGLAEVNGYFENGVANSANGIIGQSLGGMAGKTIPDLKTALLNWLALNNTNLGGCIFGANSNWITLWNNNDDTTVMSAGVQWHCFLLTPAKSPTYAEFLISTYIEENALYSLIIRNGNWGEVRKIALDDDLAKYLPLDGGTMTGNLYTKTLLPSADVTDNIGYVNLAYNVIFAKAFSINKGGKSYGDIQIITEGTEEATGTARLMVGNITPRGTAGNARGVIVLPGVGKGITQITPSNNGDSNIEVLLPSSAGTLALKSDITALNVLTEVEQTTVAYFIDYIFSNLPVSTTNIYSSTFSYNGYYTYSGIKPVDNYASFIIHGYGIRAIHMQLQNGVWVYSAMDNK